MRTRVDSRTLPKSRRRPCNSHFGGALIKSIYDASGNALDSRYFGVNDEPTTCDGYHEEVMRYDDSGHCTRREFRDAKGALVSGKFGYAIEEDEFDDRGRVTETRFRDPERRLTFGMASDRTFAVIKYQYSRNGLHTSNSVDGPDNKPMLDQYGIHRMDLTFSPLGYVTDFAAFGIEGEPVLTTFGAHHTHEERDAHGRVTSLEGFDTKGQPSVIRQLNAHRIEHVYDERGFEVGYKSFDNEGRPCPDAEGAGLIPKEPRPDDRVRLTSAAIKTRISICWPALCCFYLHAPPPSETQNSLHRR